MAHNLNDETALCKKVKLQGQNCYRWSMDYYQDDYPEEEKDPYPYVIPLNEIFVKDRPYFYLI